MLKSAYIVKAGFCCLFLVNYHVDVGWVKKVKQTQRNPENSIQI